MIIQLDFHFAHIHDTVIEQMQHWGRRHPGAGYGVRFGWWLREAVPKPCNSWGNGSPMRVSAAGWLYDDLPTVLRMAKLSAVTAIP